MNEKIFTETDISQSFNYSIGTFPGSNEDEMNQIQ
jgi:hypothetical protein